MELIVRNLETDQLLAHKKAQGYRLLKILISDNDNIICFGNLAADSEMWLLEIPNVIQAQLQSTKVNKIIKLSNMTHLDEFAAALARSHGNSHIIVASLKGISTM